MNPYRFIVVIVSLSVCLFSVSTTGVAQTAAPSSATADWETLRPEGEEFAVLMPKGSVFESGKELYHKMELNTRMYISQRPNAPVLAVVSLSGIKSNPAMYTEMQRVNSYADAFKKLFTPKLKKTGPVKFNFIRDKSFMGHPGREYSLAVGDLTGTVHAVATRRRFYAVVFLNNKKDEAIQEEFLSSFVLPERTAAPPPPTVAERTAPPNTERDPAKPATVTDGATGTPDAPANARPETKPEAAAEGDAGGRRPVRGGVLNGRAISLPKPQHPSEAREVTGTVVVEVIIDENGNVIEAKAVSGPPQLLQAAVNAALQARFSPTFLLGEAVKVTGVITYQFGRQ
jgi:TonB family protein